MPVIVGIRHGGSDIFVKSFELSGFGGSGSLCVDMEDVGSVEAVFALYPGDTYHDKGSSMIVRTHNLPADDVHTVNQLGPRQEVIFPLPLITVSGKDVEVVVRRTVEG